MSDLRQGRLRPHQWSEMLVREHALDGANAVRPLGVAFRGFVADRCGMGQKQCRHARASLRVSFADPFAAGQDLAGAPDIVFI